MTLPSQYRRTIPELVTRYELEPSLRDLFVEGDRDLHFLHWLFARSETSGVVIYKIDTVDIPEALLDGLSHSGNAGRVVAFCTAIETAISQTTPNVVGLVDRDVIEAIDDPSVPKRLLMTDFCSLEGYALSDIALTKFFSLYLGRVPQKQCINAIKHVLVELWLLRAAKYLLAPTAPWVDRFDRCCRMEGDLVVLDSNSLVDKLVGQARGQFTADRLRAQVDELRPKLQADSRFYIHGHDLVSLLAWFAHRAGVPRAIYDERPLQRALLASVEWTELVATPLFGRLVSWANSRSPAGA